MLVQNWSSPVPHPNFLRQESYSSAARKHTNHWIKITSNHNPGRNFTYCGHTIFVYWQLNCNRVRSCNFTLNPWPIHRGLILRKNMIFSLGNKPLGLIKDSKAYLGHICSFHNSLMYHWVDCFEKYLRKRSIWSRVHIVWNTFRLQGRNYIRLD